MPEFNLLSSVPRIQRNVSARLRDKSENRALSCQFGEAYFDGTREQGYGGYVYDGRWQKVAKTARDRYGLKAGDRVLDIGCAKGFFVHDLMKVVPGLVARGIDISEYAIDKSLSDVRANIQQGSAEDLPFENDSFDAVFSINTIHNLDHTGCVKALREMARVCKVPENCFVQVDAYRTSQERELFEAWMLTAKTYGMPSDWHAIFSEADYRGDFFWTILEFEENSND